ncbi:hypothetical protein HDV05_008454 [Chytridiales sp. JEL 0842]|nr:hypothetical protein HDV05_008454 [Chytridiales sp. JEL 0842]
MDAEDVNTSMDALNLESDAPSDSRLAVPSSHPESFKAVPSSPDRMDSDKTIVQDLPPRDSIEKPPTPATYFTPGDFQVQASPPATKETIDTKPSAKSSWKAIGFNRRKSADQERIVASVDTVNSHLKPSVVRQSALGSVGNFMNRTGTLSRSFKPKLSTPTATQIPATTDGVQQPEPKIKSTTEVTDSSDTVREISPSTSSDEPTHVTQPTPVPNPLPPSEGFLAGVAKKIRRGPSASITEVFQKATSYIKRAASTITTFSAPLQTPPNVPPNVPLDDEELKKLGKNVKQRRSFMNLKKRAKEDNKPSYIDDIHTTPLPSSSKTVTTNKSEASLPPLPSPPTDLQPPIIAPPRTDSLEAKHANVVAMLYKRKAITQRFLDRFELGDVLGDGAFGLIMIAIQKSNRQEVAVKFIAKEKIPDDLWVFDVTNPNGPRIPKEVAILRQLRHPGIIGYICHFSEEHYIVLVTERHGTEWYSENPELSLEKNPGLRRASGGKLQGCGDVERSAGNGANQIRQRVSCDLFECIDVHRRLPDVTCRKIFAQIALTMEYLHNRDIVHRDVKDENIVIDSNYTIKLIDFGSASRTASRASECFTKFNGTAHFASPEVAMGEPYRGPEAEMWALGCLLFTLVYGENPFLDTADVIGGQYIFPFSLPTDGTPYGPQSLVRRLLTYNPERRATIQEVVNHPWIAEEVALLEQQGYRPKVTTPVTLFR